MHSRLAFWRSPDDQPRWSRPALLAVAALAGLAYAWGLGRDPLEPYYAAAVRSMSASWHDFAYGAFDPAGTVTVDKLPGALWLQALSVRAFGVHTWALILPQVVEGVLTVLVLHRAVRRLAGPVAGIAAAVIFAASPATVGLNRGNISDTLMTLLLVVAADLTVSAVRGRPSRFLLAGVCVGLAFQAKMIQAWLIFPAFALAYLLAARGTAVRRLVGVVVAGLVTVVVSLSWLTAVSLTPHGGRPYVDGSSHDSLYEQVFVYNGFGRFGDQTPLQQLAGQSLSFGLPAAPPAGWDRLLHGDLGRDTAWLLPAALVALAGGVAARRGSPRGDPLRAHLVLWGGWLVVLFAVFSVASTINAYYTSALSPPVAALCGAGVPLAWASRRGRVVLAATVAGTAAYALWLLPGRGTGLPGWLAPAAVVLAVVAIALLVASLLRRSLAVAGVAAAAGAVLLVPATASASMVDSGLGAFDTPFQPAASTAFVRNLFVTTPGLARRDLPELERVRRGATYLLATQSSVVAAPFIYASGQEVLPIGGFTGTTPAPTLAQVEADVAAGRVHLVLARSEHDPRLAWIAAHCIHTRPRKGAATSATVPLDDYYCLPSAATGG